jgi:membrane associated rhomboid family serine protease
MRGVEPASGSGGGPIFNIPASVLGAAAVMIAVQITIGFLPGQTALDLVRLLAFIPARYSGAAAELPGGYPACVTSFVTYMLVHAGWLHLAVNLAWLVAFGSAVARRVGGRTFLTFSTLCGIAGALTHLAFHVGEMAPVVGASAAISGQMAAALRFVFGATRQSDEGDGRLDFTRAPLATLGQTFGDPRILAFLGIWVAINVIFGFTAGSMVGAEGGIAWEAHIGGFLFGLFSFGFFDRDGEPAEVPPTPR